MPLLAVERVKGASYGRPHVQFPQPLRALCAVYRDEREHTVGAARCANCWNTRFIRVCLDEGAARLRDRPALQRFVLLRDLSGVLRRILPGHLVTGAVA